jgi:uncharacterized protein YjdB
MKVRTSVLRGFALLALSSLTFAACDERAAVAPPPVIAVTVMPPSVSLLVGQTVTLIATVSGTTNQAVTWASTNTAVATVTAAGVVTAVTPGTAVITATSAADPTARSGAAVVVTAAPPPPPPTLSLVPAAATVVAGSTLQLVAIVGNTTIMGVTYASSDTAVATVSAAGLVTARRAGTAVITGRTVATPVATATSTVTVTAAPPPPTPHITIAPTTATVQVGRTQTFVATVTGVANTAVLWRSSDLSVATVTAAGVATGASPGTAVITAISVADTTRRVDATLTVTAAPPVTQPAISIQSVTLVGPPITAVTPGQTLPNDAALNVVVNVAAGSEAPIGRVEIQLGTAPPAACVQTFTPPLASTQGVQTISCVVSTTQLDAAARPRFPNGTYALSAVAFNDVGTSVATASWGTVVLANLDRLTFPAPAVTTTGVDGTGSIFVGGLEWREGNVVVRARPVIFTPGLTVASVRICVQANDGPVTAAACRTVTTADTAGVYTTTFPKANAPGHATSPGVAGITTTDLRVYGSSTFTTTAAGPSVPFAAPAASIRLDNRGPTFATARLPRAWLNADFAFTAAMVDTVPVDPTPGVGGFTYEFRWVPAAAWAADTTLAARWAAGTTVTSAAAIPPSDVSTAYHLIFRARDGLGNFGTFRVSAEAVITTFGVDLAAPTFTVVAGAPAPLTINPTLPDFSFTFTDDRAGFDANPVQVRLTRWTSNPALRRCINVNTGAVLGTDSATADPCHWITLEPGNTFPVPTAAGYYQVDISVLDRARNRSAVDSRLVLRDGAAPVTTVTGFALSGNVVTVSATITDNVAIRGFNHWVLFGAAPAPAIGATPTLPITELQHVRTFGIDRVGSHAVAASITTWRSMLVVGAGGSTAAADGALRHQTSRVGIGAWDVARNFSADTVAGGVGVPQTGGVLPAGLANWNVALSGTTACNGWMPIPSGDGGPVCVTPTPPATRTVTATATGPSGTFENPFASVNFYAVYPGGSVVLLGTVPGAAAAVVEQEAPTLNRLYRWTFTFDATQRPGGTYEIFAVGVQATRDVVRSPTAAITVQGAIRQPSTLTDRP